MASVVLIAVAAIGLLMAGCGPVGAQSAAVQSASTVAFQKVMGSPFGAAASPDGRYGFVTLISGDVLVYSLAGSAPRLLRTIRVPQGAAGCSVTKDGRLVLIANGRAGDTVLNAARAETGASHSVLGTLAPPPGKATSSFGAIETASSANGHFVFVTVEDSAQVAVYDIGSTSTPNLTTTAYVGAVSVGEAPVGIALSPNGQGLYVTSEVDTHLRIDHNGTQPDGSLSMINLTRAETDPAQAASTAVDAGNQPVRVVVSPSGSVVWVTARGSDRVLGFSTRELHQDPQHALIASVKVGTAPVGIAEFDHGSRLIVADSDRFKAKGAHAALTIIDTASALLHHPEPVISTLPAAAFPRDIAVIDTDKLALVPNFGSHQLETVSLPTP